MLNSVVKISMMSAKYFEYYTIILRGAVFSWTHCMFIKKCSLTHFTQVTVLPGHTNVVKVKRQAYCGKDQVAMIFIIHKSTCKITGINKSLKKNISKSLPLTRTLIVAFTDPSAFVATHV